MGPSNRIGFRFLEGEKLNLSDQLPNFASRRVVRPPSGPRKQTPRHGNQKSPARWRRYVRWAFKGLAVGMGAVLAVTGISVFQLSNTLKENNIQLIDAEGNAFAQPSVQDLNGPINLLLVGSDTRQGQGSGYGNEESELADVIMLLHISADRKNAVALSFPRDLLVPIPACPNPEGGAFSAMSRQQINSSIAYGGPVCTLLTIQALTGVKIPYLGVIDFRGVIEMSNAIGGVEVCVANPIDDPKAKLKLDAGVHTLQGREALAFLRTRYGIGDGSDLARISNQQVFLTSLLRKVKNEGVLNNPIYMYSLANAAARNMKLSDSMTDLGTMVALAGALRNVDLDKMTFLQVPSRGGLSGSEAGRVEPIYDQAQLIFDRIANDQPVLIKKANTGFGATPKEYDVPESETGESAEPDEDVLPEWARGTNAATELCSD
jgi:LCP family protein required for cell wall assembly